MKKIYVLTLSVVLMFVGISSVAHAQDVRQELRAQIEARKQAFEDKGIEVKAVVKMKASDRVEAAIKSVGERFVNEVNQLNNLKSRIDSRLTKFEHAGVVTTSARVDLNLAITKINLIPDTINSLTSIIVSTTTPKVSVDALKSAAKTVQEAIKTVRQSLLQVVSDMRGFEATLRKTATSTREIQQ